ncbi:tetratricopeptide repeat protein [Nocardioides sp. MH1]|uniref:tetratricopeptide repeat protein n=1 Tax=Nocardioides sp. MH1 TaxID=3242490 RepID=UPI0035223E58
MPAIALTDGPSAPESFMSEPSLLKPSADPTPPHTAGTRKRLAVEDDAYAAWLDRAHEVVRSAEARTAAVPSPTNWIRLAQAQYAAGEVSDAGNSAHTAMTEAIRLIESQQCSASAMTLVLGSGANLLARSGRQAEAAVLLRRVGPPEVLELTYASLLIDDERLQDAFDAITGANDPQADAMRGYILARQSETQRAVHYLRKALREAPEDADSVMNLASAYWRLGSRRKAINTALRAARLAPSRQDISVSYMTLLLEDNQPDRVLAELKRLRRAGVVDSARSLIVRCRAELAVGDAKKALTFLRRAVAAAENEGDTELRDEASANLRVLECSTSGQDRASTRRVALECVKDAPQNLAAVRQLAAHSARRHEAHDLQQAIANLGALPELARLDLEARLAYIRCDFEESLRVAERIVELDPMAADHCAMTVLLQGWHRGDWEAAARNASAWIKRAPFNDQLLNNAAYAMALGGMAAEALKVLDQHPEAEDFVPVATRGLAHLALGELDAGMRWYRRAAEIAHAVGAGDMLTLMALHQAAGLRKLGVTDVASEEFLAATSLPDTPLPADWDDQPGFVMIQQGCTREGWPWPPNLHL